MLFREILEDLDANLESTRDYSGTLTRDTWQLMLTQRSNEAARLCRLACKMDELDPTELKSLGYHRDPPFSRKYRLWWSVGSSWT